MSERHLLSFSCADRRGVVAKVSGFLAEQGCNITEAQQFEDSASNRFFMRVEFEIENGSFADTKAGFAGIGGIL